MNAAMIDQTKLESFVMRAVGDLSAGLRRRDGQPGQQAGSVQGHGGRRPDQFAGAGARAGCAERYVREWLNAQAAGGYVDYHAVSDTYELTPEQALVLADEDSPVFIPHAWNVPARCGSTRRRPSRRSAPARAWPGATTRTAVLRRGRLLPQRLSRQSGAQWLPALDGVVARLEAGITVADVGCGHGHSTMLMAEAFPRSRFYGFDTHAPRSRGRRNAAEAGVGEAGRLRGGPGGGLPRQRLRADLLLRRLHDMGDPVAAARHAAARLPPVARSCWSNRSPTTGSKTTCRRSRGSTMPLRPRFAARTRSRRAVARPRRAGGRGAPRRGLPQGGLHALSARGGDPLQPDPRSAALRFMAGWRRPLMTPGRSAACGRAWCRRWAPGRSCCAGSSSSLAVAGVLAQPVLRRHRLFWRVMYGRNPIPTEC
jgi:hypothetical protein